MTKIKLGRRLRLSIAALCAPLLLLLLLSACGESEPSYTYGGTVTGLSPGASLTLMDSPYTLTVTSNGAYQFDTVAPDNGPYDVSVMTPPTGETCVISNGVGRIPGSNVTNINVACTTTPQTTYTVGGSVTGFNSSSALTLTDGTDNLNVTASGAFTFGHALFNEAAYQVTVLTQPTGQTCMVTNGAGAINAANVTAVAINCVLNTPPTYTVGGTVSGLAMGQSLQLRGGLGDVVQVSANGNFQLPAAFVSGAPYSVTVSSQPPGQTCTVTSGVGTVGTANVSSVAVSCTANPTTFSIGGTVSGLASRAVTLLDNGSDSLTVSTDGNFLFPAPLPPGTAYAVTVGTQPAGETCTVAGGTGTVTNARVSSVTVSCTANPTYSIGGVVQGSVGGVVTLLDNGSDSLTVPATNGSFVFPVHLLSGAAYAVTVGTQPAGGTCSIISGTGTVASANVVDVTVICP